MFSKEPTVARSCLGDLDFRDAGCPRVRPLGQQPCRSLTDAGLVVFMILLRRRGFRNPLDVRTRT